MKKFYLFLLSVLIAFPSIAYAADCNQIQNSNWRFMCKKQFSSIQDRDLRMFATGRCYLVNDMNLYLLCTGKANLVQDSDLRALGQAECYKIQNRDIKIYCESLK